MRSYCLSKLGDEARGVRLFLDAAFVGTSTMPHLPEAIRRHVHAFTLAGARRPLIALRCGHRFHEACWQRATTHIKCFACLQEQRLHTAARHARDGPACPNCTSCLRWQQEEEVEMEQV